MGELHLEIIHDRIQRDYHVRANLGKLRVAYREAPTIPVTLGGQWHTHIDTHPWRRHTHDRHIDTHMYCCTLSLPPHSTPPPGSLDRNLGNKRQFVSLSLTITPIDNGQLPQIKLSPSVSIPSWTTAADVLESFRGGVDIACGQGKLKITSYTCKHFPSSSLPSPPQVHCWVSPSEMCRLS